MKLTSPLLCVHLTRIRPDPERLLLTFHLKSYNQTDCSARYYEFMMAIFASFVHQWRSFWRLKRSKWERWGISPRRLFVCSFVCLYLYRNVCFPCQEQCLMHRCIEQTTQLSKFYSRIVNRRNRLLHKRLKTWGRLKRSRGSSRVISHALQSITVHPSCQCHIPSWRSQKTHTHERMPGW